MRTVRSAQIPSLTIHPNKFCTSTTSHCRQQAIWRGRSGGNAWSERRGGKEEGEEAVPRSRWAPRATQAAGARRVRRRRRSGARDAIAGRAGAGGGRWPVSGGGGGSGGGMARRVGRGRLLGRRWASRRRAPLLGCVCGVDEKRMCAWRRVREGEKVSEESMYGPEILIGLVWEHL